MIHKYICYWDVLYIFWKPNLFGQNKWILILIIPRGQVHGRHWATSEYQVSHRSNRREMSTDHQGHLPRWCVGDHVWTHQPQGKGLGHRQTDSAESVLSSHILTFPPLHFVVCRLESRYGHVFCLLPSHLPSGFLPCPLSPGLAISALVCLDFPFHLPSSAISFSWHHLYLASAHIQTISKSSHSGILSSGTCVLCAYFQMSAFSHDLVLTHHQH